MATEALRVGYEIVREFETTEVSYACLACDERIGLHAAWPSREITREEATSKQLVCEACEELLAVAELERQIAERDTLLADLSRFLEYDLGGVNEPDYGYVRQLIKRIEPFGGSAQAGYRYFQEYKKRRRQW
jgi:hypothetical protein